MAKTIYQMLEILSSRDQERALPLSTEIGVLRVTKLNVVQVVVLVLESKAL